jgi:hypothetical protein
LAKAISWHAPRKEKRILFMRDIDVKNQKQKTKSKKNKKRMNKTNEQKNELKKKGTKKKGTTTTLTEIQGINILLMGNIWQYKTYL